MKRLLLLLPAVLLMCMGVKAQMIETVDMDHNNLNAETFLTGINNKGFVTGYYTSNSIETGFVITSTGRALEVTPAMVGTTSVRVEGINDNNVSIVVGQTGNNTTVYKFYYNAAKDTFSHKAVVTMSQPNAMPKDINNKNDISGWYAGSQNFLFVKHDSIVPTGNNAWEARRVPDVLPNYFSTSGAGINDNNQVSGWYINGSNQAAMVYDNIAHTFNSLNSIYRIRLSDINNNGIICGEYRQTNNNNTYMAFYGTPGSGTILNFSSLLGIFQTGTIQSIANGINDNMDIAGSFLDPNTNRWCGFIYHPNVAEYRMPGTFDVQTHTWSNLRNSLGGPMTVWPTGYYQGSNYTVQDPYANNGEALLTPELMATHQLTTLPDIMSPTWKGYATECDENGIGVSTNPNDQDYYKSLLKYKLFDKWMPMADYGFKGYCYGFTTTALQHYFEDATFSSWFGIPANTNISQITNTDFNAIKAIERSQMKQMDKPTIRKNTKPRWLWGQMYHLKLEYLKTFALSDPSNLGINTGGNDWHSILPYKIKTPKTLPFSAPDTLFFYDPNYPGDSTRNIKVWSVFFLSPNDATMMSSTTYPALKYMDFPMAGVRYMNTRQHTQLKSTAATEYDDMYTFSVPAGCYYDISMNGSPEVKVDVNGYDNTSLNIQPIIRYNQNTPHNEHVLDSNMTVNITTYNYASNAMVWTQVNNSRSMGISRPAQASETDHSTQSHKMITYGNPDNVGKTLAAFMRETENARQQGVNIMVTNICADPGDSIVTQSPSPYVFNVTKVNGSNNCNYNLDIYAAYGGVMHEFHSGATIQPNSSHTIDPYFTGTNGTQIAVIVDNGMDGVPDDTLFVIGWPLNMKGPDHKLDLKVYPNPVTDMLTLEFGNIGESYTASLTDMVGRVVYTAVYDQPGRNNLPMKEHPAGIYLLQVTDKQGRAMYREKIVKQ